MAKEYSPYYYADEYNSVIQHHLYTACTVNGRVKYFNHYAFFGNIILDCIFSQYKDVLSSCTITSQSGYTDQDALVITNTGRRLFIELKMRHDDSHITFPHTCLGEEYKYVKLLEKAKEKNAEPFIAWCHKDGSVNVFNLGKIPTPKWNIKYIQKDNYEKDKENKLMGLYYKKNSYRMQLENYNSILNYLCTELNLKFIEKNE